MTCQKSVRPCGCGWLLDRAFGRALNIPPLLEPLRIPPSLACDGLSRAANCSRTIPSNWFGCLSLYHSRIAAAWTLSRWKRGPPGSKSSNMMARAEVLCPLTHPGFLDLGIVACDQGMYSFVVVHHSAISQQKKSKDEMETDSFYIGKVAAQRTHMMLSSHMNTGA